VCRIDIALLALLRSAGQQNHQGFAIAPEINPVSGAEIDAEFEYAFANRFHVGEVTPLEPGDRTRNFDSGDEVEILEPVGRSRQTSRNTGLESEFLVT
jgi:hypothetical protein